jgi:hypothetical protein
VYLKRNLLAIFSLIIFLGCSGASDKKEGMHPDPTHFPPDSVVDFSVDVSGNQKITKPLPHLFNSDNLNTHATIGADSVLANEYHQKPKQIDIDPDGNIYIVQNRNNQIRVYNTQGQFKYSIGGNGRGPGEFAKLITFVFDNEYKTLYVLDFYQIEIFEKIEGRFEYKTSEPHKFVGIPSDMCRLNEALYISGRKMTEKGKKAYEDEEVRGVQAANQPPITKIDMKTFNHMQSFGFEYKSHIEWGAPDADLSKTVLSCNEFSNTVVGYLKHFPYIFGYDTTGQRKWVSKLDGYLSTKFREERTSEGPAFYHYVNEKMFHWKYPIQKIDNKQYSLLQFGHTGLIDYFQNTKKSERREPRTILVNTQTGKLLLSDAYKYLGGWQDDTVITMDINPENLIKTFPINELQ